MPHSHPKIVEYQLDYFIQINGHKQMGSDVRFDMVGALKVAAKWLEKGYTVTIKPKQYGRYDI